jgi:hypothetical protein
MNGCHQMSQPISAESNTPKQIFLKIFFLIVTDFGAERAGAAAGAGPPKGWRTGELAG